MDQHTMRAASKERANDVVIAGRLVEDGRHVRVTIRGTRIARVEPAAEAPDSVWISPGWIDLQVNGFQGSDVNAETVSADTVSTMVRSLWASGVTAVCPTVCTAAEERLLAAFRAIAAACEGDPLVASSLVGIHVEGPHIAREDGPRGAHPLEHVRPPDVQEYRRWQAAAGNRIRIITLSPEYGEAATYIRAVTADGVVASIGHTAATADQIKTATDEGASWSTHLGNGAHAVLPRHPNYIWDQLADDRLSAGLIFDGHHLPPAVMRAFVRAKGIARSILVSDAVALAGSPPGPYRSAAGDPVELTPSGRLTLSGTPFLAGSVATLPDCLGNAMRHVGLEVRDATRLITANPSRLLGLASDDGHETIRPGNAANITLFRQDRGSFSVTVTATFVAGTPVFIDPHEGGRAW